MHKIINLYRSNSILAISFILLAFQFNLNFVFSQQNKDDYSKVRTVVLDPGHGGKDSGAIGKHSKEKDIVLSIALKTGKYIEENLPDVKVLYTRTTDVLPALDERAKIANDADADLFISIHANANENTSAKGSETFVMGMHKTEANFEVAKKENSVMVLDENYETRYQGFDPNDIESYIMIALMQDIYQEQSIMAAGFVQDQFRERVKRKDRGVNTAGFWVLWETSMPSILIETAFISNEEEEKFLMSESGQDYLASAIFRAFRNYKEYIEGNSQIITLSNNKEDTAIKEISSPNLSQAMPDINSTTKKSVEEDIIPAHKDVVFKVQILYAENQVSLKDTIFYDFNDIEEINENGKYKYLVGAKKTYDEILEYSKWVKSRHPDAFIVAVSNGKIIPLSEAMASNK